MTARTTQAPTAPAPAGAVASPGRRGLAWGLAAAILFLVFMGAQVKSHDAGLAVNDWPLAYGQLWPRMVGGVFHEHWHRAIGAGVGVLAVTLAVWTARVERHAHVRRLAWALLGAVVVQGLLGGLTVKLLLPPAVSATHAVLAQAVLCLASWLAYATGRRRAVIAPCSDPGVGRAALTGATLALVALFIQLGLGAWMRHTEAGLAVPFFPVDGAGRWLPEVVDERVAVHMAHRVWALVVTVIVWRAALLAGRSDPALMAHGAAVAGAVLMQGVLGAAVVWTGRAPVVASLHVANGALVLVLTWLLVLRLGRRAPDAAPVPGRPALERPAGDAA